MGKDSLQVRKRNISIHHEAIKLVELDLMSGVSRFIAKNLARHNNPDRQFPLFHFMNLNTRCVSPENWPRASTLLIFQTLFGFNPKRILHVARRVIWGDIESVEII